MTQRGWPRPHAADPSVAIRCAAESGTATSRSCPRIGAAAPTRAGAHAPRHPRSADGHRARSRLTHVAGRAQVLVPGGSFRMGSVDFYPEERPVTKVTVDELWVDEHPVTNAEFRRFVKDTGHITIAERAPDLRDFPGAD